MKLKEDRYPEGRRVRKGEITLDDIRKKVPSTKECRDFTDCAEWG